MRKLILLSLLALTFSACLEGNDVVATNLGDHVHHGIVFKDLTTGKCIGIDGDGDVVTFTVVTCPEVVR